MVHAHPVGSGDKRTSYCVPCLQLQLLTVWAGRVTISILPDDVLLHIFYFDGLDNVDRLWHLSWWHRLVHVCWRWRSLIFTSPNFLNLRLVCGPWTPEELTGIWPPLPIIITNMVDGPKPEDYNFDVAIVHHNRVCEVNLLRLTSLQLQRVALAMQEQFPALIHLMLDFDSYHGSQAPALPNGFLGGSTPRLQFLTFHSIPFPALPKLLLSATDLVRLTLRNIPHSGYFSPETIVPSLAVLANLKSLVIAFESPNRVRRRIPPPTGLTRTGQGVTLTRTVLPALTRFEFQGVSEYLEDFVARIDAPLLESIWITFFHQLIFHIPQLAQFMGRTTRLQVSKEAHVEFDNYGVQVESLPATQAIDEKSRLRISCRELDWQLSSLAQVFTSFFPSISMVETLYIFGPGYLPPHWKDEIENVQVLDIFRPFTGVKNLYACERFTQCIAPALQELVVERGWVTDVLPRMESLFLEGLRQSGPIKEAIGQFVGARQLSDHSVAVSRWEETRDLFLHRLL